MLKNKWRLSAIGLFAVFFTTLFFQNCSQTNDFSTEQSKKAGSSSSNESNNTGSIRPGFGVTDPTLGTSCTRPGYNGWQCWQTNVTSQENVSYQIELRWNRVGKSSVGTVISAVGGNGSGASRENTSIPAIRQFMDELDQLDQIRMVEIDFLDPSNDGVKAGGYFKSPTGYYAAASAFLAAVELIFQKNLVQGTFVNYFGGSNGTMVAAYAMSHFGADKYFDRVLFQIGPFLPNFADACNPNHWASFRKSPDQYGFIKELVNSWVTGSATTDACTRMSPDRVSISKTPRVRFPKTAVHVVVGLDEVTKGFGPWILESNLQWYENVEAPEKTRVGIPGMGHEVAWDHTRIYLNRRPPAAMRPDPVFKFSFSSGGAAIAQLPLGRTVVGEVEGLTATDAASCMGLIGTNYCDNPHNWTAMPANGWTFNSSTGKWMIPNFLVDSNTLKAGQKFEGFWQDRSTGQRTKLIRVEIVPPTTLNSFAEPLGKFCSPSRTLTFFSCRNGNPGPGWIAQADGCYHRATQEPCSP